MRTQVIGVRLGDDVLAALDGKRGDVGRVEYIRSVLERDLGLTVRKAPLAGVAPVSALDRVRGHPLLSRVYGAVVEKPGTVREVAGRLGIDVATAERAEAQLSKLGVVHYPVRGVMEAV
jgi:hypothetical protein